jgi:prevent-host-death family protein
LQDLANSIDMDHTLVHIVIRWSGGGIMRVAVTNAKGQLTELVRRAQAGEEVILTRHGLAVVRLVPVEAPIAPEARRKLLEAARASGAAKARQGESAARSQDFLYGLDGLPG